MVQQALLILNNTNRYQSMDTFGWHPRGLLFKAPWGTSSLGEHTPWGRFLSMNFLLRKVLPTRISTQISSYPGNFLLEDLPLMGNCLKGPQGTSSLTSRYVPPPISSFLGAWSCLGSCDCAKHCWGFLHITSPIFMICQHNKLEVSIYFIMLIFYVH